MELLILLASLFIETFLTAGAGLSIIGIRLKIQKLIVIAAIFGFLIYGIRMFYEIYQIPLGTHTFIIIIILTVVLKILTKQKLTTSIIAILISYLLITLGEGIFMYNVFRLFNITMEDMLSNGNIRFLGTMLTNIPLIIVFIIGHVYKKSIIDINYLNEKEEV
ncbi:hypothetical protein [Maledivibacter halophilus]|uniref:Uncharacterized protein n=1 Tax=Maledivibacter halophilus TaxID=36842 RepID=A0A1T5M4U1_9FIRM|nr:hypothetical protein [Maledivibacter halophilus]SKC83230.1 hypothetical protein SAMN02194393_03849 [Maledivibacter halophilus]